MCGLNKVPKTIGKLSSLEQLTLDNNNIFVLPKSIYKLKNLKYLSLKSNKLTAISDYICLLKNLEVLDLRGNYFKEYDVAVLKALLPKCRVLY